MVFAHAETPNSWVDSSSVTGRDDRLLPLRDALEDALTEVFGHDATVVEPPAWLADAGIDLVVHLDDVTLAVEVKAAPTVADVHRLATLTVPTGTYKVLAGGRISRAVDRS